MARRPLRAAGLVPEGVEIVYAASNVKPPEPAPQSEAARLAAAKAAVAALTGKPVSGRLSTDLAENLVQVKEPPLPEPDRRRLSRRSAAKPVRRSPPFPPRRCRRRSQTPKLPP